MQRNTSNSRFELAWFRRAATLVSLLAVTNVMAGKPSAPATPTNLGATAVSSSQINLTWTDNATDETQYIVERSISSSTTYTAIATLGANSTSYANTGLNVSTKYNYRVQAYNANGNKNLQYSGYSGVASATTPAVTYTVATTPAPTVGGSTSGGGTLPSGATANVSASPNSGYNFVNWTENGSQVSASANYSFTVTGNRNLMANFNATTVNYTITTSSSPSVGGTTSGGGTKTSGTLATVTASANSGYSFVNWTENGSQVSANSTYSFTVTGNRSLVANFSTTSTSYTITTSSAPSAGGTTSGGGTKTSGSVATLTASANSGYSFVNWTESGVQVSTSSSYSFTVTGNRSLVANFTSQPTYTIAASSSPAGGASISGTGNYVSGSTVTLDASPNPCYNFVNWTENGVQVSTSSTYSFTATGNRTLVANFSQPSYGITTSASPSTGGTTSGGGTKTCGTFATISATANPGYTFLNWTENGNVVSSSPNYSFTVVGSRSYVANFTGSGSTFTITTSSSPSAGGSTSGGGSKTSGTVATVLASANSGYSFVNWTENGVQVSTSASYSFTVTGNRTLVANFSTTTTTYTITTSSSPTAGGTTSGGGTKTSGTVATVIASASSGYSFVNWTENGAQVSTSASYSFTVTGNRTLVANFTTTTTTYTITTSSSPSVGGSTSGGGSKTSGTVATVIASANSGYSFVNWTENGAQVSTSASYSFTVTGNRTLVANFASTSGGSWAFTVGGSAVDLANAVGTDSAGNIFVAGYFNGTVNFGGTSLSSAGAADIFVAKYSPAGAMLWAKRFGSTGDDQPMALAVDRSSGDVVVTGYFMGTVAFGSTTYNSIGGRDLFLVKLTGAAGAVSWSKQIGGQYGVDGEDIGYGVAIDPRNGDVVLTGQISGWFDIGTGWILTTSASSDTLLARLSSNGTYQWAKTFVANGVDRGTAVAVDASGNILLAGTSSGMIDLGGGALPLGGWFPDTYVTKLSPTGAHIWSKGFGNDSYTGVNAIALDGSGNVVLTGFFSGNLDLGAGVLVGNNSGSGYVVKFSASNGSTIWSRAFVASASTAGLGVATDGAGNVLVTGSFYLTCDFGGGTLTAPSSIHEGFLAKYAASNGAHLSSQRFGGTGDDRGYAVVVDGSGNTIVAGTTAGGDFSGANLTTAGSNDIFLMKLTP